ncbi:MAG: Do family serine endopeptidase [Bacteroidetes bacterium]|nr:Do family serine endopeptidase [Bacteroidota bacterium]HET6244294.1 Do family serine endopeptidase [Bacteroidia bacterium]
MRILKNTAGAFLIAIIGGFTALGISEFKENNSRHKELLTDNRTFPVNYTLPDKAAASGSDFVMAAEMTVNSVVHVTTVTQTTTEEFDPFEYFFRGGEIQPRPHTQLSAGSGVIISDDGYIVTNNHVITNADKIEVVLNNRTTYEAKVIGTDPTTDLALLKIKAKDLPYITFGNSDKVRIGEWVLAVGNPFNLTSTVTAGIVSAKGRSINILQQDAAKGIFPIESFIQTDAAVNPGNSGGALVNINGELVGINTAIASGTGFFSGYSFAIPVNIVKKVSKDLIEFGEVQRAFLGVSITDIDSRFAQDHNLKELKGVFVAGLTEGGSAIAAGIKQGDVITKIEERDINSVPELQEQISKYRPGDKIEVTIIRNGNEKIIKVTLKSLNGATSVSNDKTDSKEKTSALGAVFAPVTKTEMKRLKIQGGAKVERLGPGKLQSAGVQESFIITRIDKQEILSPEDVISALENLKGGTLIEGVYPNGMRAYYGFGL